MPDTKQLTDKEREKQLSQLLNECRENILDITDMIRYIRSTNLFLPDPKELDEEHLHALNFIKLFHEKYLRRLEQREKEFENMFSAYSNEYLEILNKEGEEDE